MIKKLHVLFVCSKNRWRSPTAENIYKKDPRLVVRSAGIHSSSDHQITVKDVEWADRIFVMEEKHKSAIRKQFKMVELPKMYSLDIPDEYGYMEEELIEIIRLAVENYLLEI